MASFISTLEVRSARAPLGTATGDVLSKLTRVGQQSSKVPAWMS